MKTLLDHVEEVYLIHLQRCNTDNPRVVREINNTDPYRLLELISVILERMKQDFQPVNNVPAVMNEINGLKNILVRKEQYIEHLISAAHKHVYVPLTQDEFEARP